MDELNFHHDFDNTLKVLLMKNDELIKSELEKYGDVVFSYCDKTSEVSNLHSQLHADLLQHQDKVKEKTAQQIAEENEIKSLQKSKETMDFEIEKLNAKLKSLEKIFKEKIVTEEDLVKNLKPKQQIDEEAAQNVETAALFKKHFGLEIRPLKNRRIQFIFHNVFEDPSDLVFVILQLVNKVYHLMESEPKLNNLKELEDQLNKTNNLGGFIQLCRKRLIEEALRSDTK